MTAGNSAGLHFCAYAGFIAESGEYWIYLEVNEGSYGGRHGKDAMDSVDNLMANTRNNPIEELDMRFPVRCEQYELRPESAARSGRVFEAQAEHFRQVFTPVLEAAVGEGVMRRDGTRYVVAAPVPRRERLRWRRHFRRSKARTTARWFKHTATFVNWLPYIVRKVERHTGRTIELTTLERKLPLIFLWPRLIHVLLTRPRREIES